MWHIIDAGYPAFYFYCAAMYLRYPRAFPPAIGSHFCYCPPYARPSPLKLHERYRRVCVCVTRRNSRERASRSLESRFTDPRRCNRLSRESLCLSATVDSCSLTFSVSIQGVPRPQLRLSPRKVFGSGLGFSPGKKPRPAEAPSHVDFNRRAFRFLALRFESPSRLGATARDTPVSRRVGRAAR